MQVSNDNGQSFGPTLKLALDGTIGWSSQGKTILSHFVSEIVMRFIWINSLKMIRYVFSQLNFTFKNLKKHWRLPPVLLIPVLGPPLADFCRYHNQVP